MATKKPLIERLGKRLLEQLRVRKITNREAAEKLGVSEGYLCRVVSTLQSKEPSVAAQERKAASDLAKTRRQLREQLAKKVLRNQMTLEKAAKEAGCSLRTMHRYVAAYRG